MRSIICLAAQGVIRNVEDNHISVFNIMEGITAEGFPLFIPRFSFFALLERAMTDDDRVIGRFRATLNGSNIHEQDVDINFQGLSKNRVIFTLIGLVLPQPGTLSLSLTLPTGFTASYVIEANAVSSAQSEATPSPQSQANT